MTAKTDNAELRNQWAEGEIEAGTLLDTIDALANENAELRQRLAEEEKHGAEINALLRNSDLPFYGSDAEIISQLISKNAELKQQPDWSDSKTGLLECWKDPRPSLQENLLRADGAVTFRDEVIANLRQQLAEAEQANALSSWRSYSCC